MTDLRGWLAGRTPPPPEALGLAAPEGTGDGAADLAAAGMDTLDRALAGTGERGGAYDLLVADALLTYACERAAGAPDPEPELLLVLDRVGRRPA